MKYHLAGAYDSNIALLLTVGENRLGTYDAMAEVLRSTVLLGKDLSTNLEFHYGLVNWFIGNNINARPTTKFIVPYLTAVGLLKDQSNDLDVAYAYQQICANKLVDIKDADEKANFHKILVRKQLLLTRPIERLLAEPHVLAGWLSVQQNSFDIQSNNQVQWLENPIRV